MSTPTDDSASSLHSHDGGMFDANLFSLRPGPYVDPWVTEWTVEMMREAATRLAPVSLSELGTTTIEPLLAQMWPGWKMIARSTGNDTPRYVFRHGTGGVVAVALDVYEVLHGSTSVMVDAEGIGTPEQVWEVLSPGERYLSVAGRGAFMVSFGGPTPLAYLTSGAEVCASLMDDPADFSSIGPVARLLWPVLDFLPEQEQTTVLAQTQGSTGVDLLGIRVHFPPLR